MTRGLFHSYCEPPSDRATTSKEDPDRESIIPGPSIFFTADLVNLEGRIVPGKMQTIQTVTITPHGTLIRKTH